VRPPSPWVPDHVLALRGFEFPAEGPEPGAADYDDYGRDDAVDAEDDDAEFNTEGPLEDRGDID